MTDWSEYDVGKVIKVKLPAKEEMCAVTIVKAFTPFTMSPVLVVSLQTKSGTPLSFGNDSLKVMVLKMHDRRCIHSMRESYIGQADYREEERAAYNEYLSQVGSGELKAIDFGEAENKTCKMDDFTPAMMEGYFDFKARVFFYEAEL